MKKECEIVQDLLFGYNDGVASDSSKKLVENHLQNCENCKQALEDIRRDRNKQDNKEEINYLEKINKNMKRKTIITIISMIILGIFVMGNIYIWLSYYNERSYFKIYLKDEISSEQLGNLKEILEDKCGKDKIEYSSKEDELNKVKKLFQEKKNVIETYEIDNPFNAVLIVKAKQKEAELILQKIENLEEIERIVTNDIENPYLWFVSKIYNKIIQE